MKVHIVSRDYKSNQILARLVKILAEQRGFTVADVPDDNADINYFFPYLEWDKYRGYRNTKTAAWFTHKDVGRPEKELMWDEAAQAVDLRTTSAVLYQKQLQKFGKTEIVTVPLDRKKFKPINQEPNTKFTVGTSGYVYPGSRKGEELIARLAKEKTLDVNVVASGRGWPVKTTHYEWDAMQDFYHGLNCYLCTSTIEGIGYGPIEAMACGIPVVVPMGVGIFDELPNLENLHRYKAGNYKDMLRAIKECWDTLKRGGYNPSSLWTATVKYSAKNWVNEHTTAFEELLYGVPDCGSRPEWQSSAGVYYVAYGKPARKCAVDAIRSFKKYMGDVPVALASDKPLNAGEDVFVQNADLDIGGRSVKTQIYDLAPKDWNYVLYLDADTEVVSSDLKFLFEALVDGWEAVFCTNPDKYCILSYAKRPDCIEEFNLTLDKVSALSGSEILQLNGGVFAFRRSERTAAFFRSWHSEWQRYGARDQMALHRVLYENPLRVLVLGNEWNTITRYVLPSGEVAAILHHPMSARDWGGSVPGRLDSPAAWNMVDKERAARAMVKEK